MVHFRVESIVKPKFRLHVKVEPSFDSVGKVTKR